MLQQQLYQQLWTSSVGRRNKSLVLVQCFMIALTMRVSIRLNLITYQMPRILFRYRRMHVEAVTRVVMQLFESWMHLLDSRLVIKMAAAMLERRSHPKKHFREQEEQLTTKPLTDWMFSRPSCSKQFAKERPSQSRYGLETGVRFRTTARPT